MRRIRRFAKLDSQDRTLFLRALALVGAIRAGLCLLPFRLLQEFAAKTRGGASAPLPVERCVWAVRAASRFVPGATCLTQALAAQVLLARAGCDSRIEIGVTRDEQHCFRAHAWVTCGSEIVIGGANVDRYVPLAAWETIAGRSNQP
jgi:hypothetical protein